MTRLWIAMMMAFLMWPLSLAASASMASQHASVQDQNAPVLVICSEMGSMLASDQQKPPVSVKDCTHCAVCSASGGLKVDTAIVLAVLFEVLSGETLTSPPVIVETAHPELRAGLSLSRASRAPPVLS